MKSKILLLMIAIMSFAVVSCTNGKKEINATEFQREVGNIELAVANIEKTSEGMLYTVKVINNSSYIIKQASVFLSYPKMKYKSEADEKQFDVEANKDKELKMLLPAGTYIGNVTTNEVFLELRGYLKEIVEKNGFHMSGSVEAYIK
ncbi:hypothetical protein CDQ84_18435 [Clostridium thermosuccinogenes]|uniref:DUF4352 domain-containing protein n=1 Tax=Clostridium thermosuccinogenes TaxID=84032 RepID=A0A2K2EZ67_9CLOT|nr:MULTISPECIES: hypothetical protein [Oscillospiraceae]AUS96079.1 hypothetical protein CDO33_06280 [Pseudoclostridium thermosuccinogenes]PNT91831.1 hypothetical protein CDQ85_18675 [Pseudoclostridium thermosuccinogenes]PNT94719.1 hypothetical protein CDQ84_18435 [Pseudoclostridium thermosuccinogenes]